MLNLLGLFESKDFISVDFSGSAVKVARASVQENSLSLSMTDKQAVAGMDDSNKVEKYTEALREIKTRNAISNRENVVFSLPTNSVIVRHVELPSMPNQRLSEVIKYEAESHIPFPIDDVNLDYHVLEETDEGTRVLLVVVKDEKLEKYLEVLRNVELRPELVDISAFSLFNIYQKLKPADADGDEESQPKVLVDIGHDNTDIIIFEDETLYYARSASVAGKSMTEAVSEELGVDSDRAEELKIEYGNVPLSESEIEAGEAPSAPPSDASPEESTEDESESPPSPPGETPSDSDDSDEDSVPPAPPSAEKTEEDTGEESLTAEETEPPSPPGGPDEETETPEDLESPSPATEDQAEPTEGSAEDEVAGEHPPPDAPAESSEPPGPPDSTEEESVPPPEPPSGSEESDPESDLTMGSPSEETEDDDDESYDTESADSSGEVAGSESESEDETRPAFLDEDEGDEDEPEEQPPETPGAQDEEDDSSVSPPSELNLGGDSEADAEDSDSRQESPAEEQTESDESPEPGPETGPDLSLDPDSSSEPPDPDDGPADSGEGSSADDTPASSIELGESADETLDASGPDESLESAGPGDETLKDTETDESLDLPSSETEGSGTSSTDFEKPEEGGDVPSPEDIDRSEEDTTIEEPGEPDAESASPEEPPPSPGDEEETDSEESSGPESSAVEDSPEDETETDEADSPEPVEDEDDEGGLGDLPLGDRRTPEDDPESDDDEEDHPGLGAAANTDAGEPQSTDFDEEALRSALQSQVDRLINELRQTFDYFQNEMDGDDVGEIILCGSGCKLNNLPAYIENELTRETRRFDPLAKMKGIGVEDLQSMLVVAGLQLRSAPSDSTLAINLLPREIVRRRERKKRNQKLIANGVLAGILVLQVLVWLFYSYRVRKNHYLTSQNQLDKVQPIVQRVEELNETKEKLQRRIAVIDDLEKRQGRILPILHELNQLPDELKERTWFENFSINEGERYPTLDIDGITGDFEDTSKIYGWFQDRDFVVSIENQNQGRTTYTVNDQKQSRVRFSVSSLITFNPEAAASDTDVNTN